MKTALITGITGQDGSYLAELLLSKDYQVVGLVSKAFSIGEENIAHIKDKLVFEDGDLLDQASLDRVFASHNFDEVYNLAGITYVPASWEKPTLTQDVNLLGVSRILELIAKKYSSTKFYQASSSKIFGNPSISPQTESTPIQPQDPYSVSKAAAHQLTQVMRNHFNIYACCGILFNHESERRGVEFVTRKITQAAAQIKLGLATQVELGDLEAKQDWGYAPDYVEAMWLMLQQEVADDFVIASGQQHTVRNICEIAFGELELKYEDYVVNNSKFIRREQGSVSVGNTQKAQQILGWQPKVSFEEMIKRMVHFDLSLQQNHT